MSKSPSTLSPDTLIVAGRPVIIHKSHEEIGVISGTNGKILVNDPKALVVTVELDDEAYRNPPKSWQKLCCSIPGANCVYHFDVQYINCAPLPSKLWCLTTPQNIYRCQHRDFIRVPASHLKLTVNYPKKVIGFSDPQEVPLIDISGNGLGFVSKRHVAIDKELLVEIDGLPGFPQPLSTMGIVRRCHKIQSSKDEITYHIGVSLDYAMSTADQNKLVRAVSEIQRMYLGKGVGIK